MADYSQLYLWNEPEQYILNDFKTFEKLYSKSIDDYGDDSEIVVNYFNLEANYRNLSNTIEKILNIGSSTSFEEKKKLIDDFEKEIYFNYDGIEVGVTDNSNDKSGLFNAFFYAVSIKKTSVLKPKKVVTTKRQSKKSVTRKTKK